MNTDFTLSHCRWMSLSLYFFLLVCYLQLHQGAKDSIEASDNVKLVAFSYPLLTSVSLSNSTSWGILERCLNKDGSKSIYKPMSFMSTRIIAFSTWVSCFHHRWLELLSINTNDYCRVIWLRKECQSYPFLIKIMSQMRNSKSDKMVACQHVSPDVFCNFYQTNFT